MTSVHDFIDEAIKNNNIVLFMKGTKNFPQCGFSNQAVQILQYLNVPFLDVNVLEDEDLRQEIKDYSQWPTIPQLYIKGEFIGGADIMKEMFQTNELKELLETKNLLTK